MKGQHKTLKELFKKYSINNTAIMFLILGIKFA